MIKGKNILVTGGTGLVGRELVELLIKEGANVTSVSLDENNLCPEWGVRYIKADLRYLKNCLDACKGMEYIFHIAGIKGSPILTKTQQYTFFTSVLQMNTNMISAMYASNIEWGLYTSTVGTYGQANVFFENDMWNKNPSPNDWFAGWAKRMGEVQIDAFEKQYGVRKISIIKPVNIYGKYDNFDLKTSTLVPSLVRKVSEAKTEVLVWGDGTTKRDIIHAKDVARAALFAVENKIDSPINVGNGIGISIKDLILNLIKISNKNLIVKYDNTKPKGDDFRIANIDRLKSYGFKSTISLEDGLKDTYNWYINNKNVTGRYDAFQNIDHINFKSIEHNL